MCPAQFLTENRCQDKDSGIKTGCCPIKRNCLSLSDELHTSMMTSMRISDHVFVKRKVSLAKDADYVHQVTCKSLMVLS